MAGVLLLHSVALSLFVFFQEEKWLSFQKRETEHRGSSLLWVSLCETLLHLVTSNTNWNGFLLLMRQIISWLALNVGTLSHWPPLASCFWHFIIPQTMGISFNCTSHWHLTWFTKHYRSFSVSLLLCSVWIGSLSTKPPYVRDWSNWGESSVFNTN